jgi:hypothetical protein
LVQGTEFIGNSATNNVLQTGSSNLMLADINEEAANS